MVLGGEFFLMSEVSLYPAPRENGAAEAQPMKQAEPWGKLRFTILRGYLAHKKTPTPLGTP